MEIIKHGDPEALERKRNPRYTFKCRECGCIFKCGKGFYEEDFWRNETIRQAWCPECKSQAYEFIAP